MKITKEDLIKLLEEKSVEEVLELRKEVVEAVNYYLEEHDYIQTLSEDNLKETIYKALVARDSSWKSQNRDVYFGIDDELYRAEIILNKVDNEELEAIEKWHREQCHFCKMARQNKKKTKL